LDVPADLARKLPKYELVPATLLGRLAVSINFRGRGLGRKLLLDALYRCLQSSRQVASTTVIVDARDDEARAFYRKYGFIELPKVERRLLLPMATIEALFGE
jgi:predicted GNAT family N-acyltransferase